MSMFDRFPWLSTTILTLGMLIPGTINTLSKKAQNETLSIGINGQLAPFNHPWFQTFVMYIGEALCFLVFLFLRFYYRRREEQVGWVVPSGSGSVEERAALLKTHPYSGGYRSSTGAHTLEINDDQDIGVVPRAGVEEIDAKEAADRLLYMESPWFRAKFILPTLCDLLGTSLSGIGLLWVPASIWQMLRGSIIIWAGILSVVFLKRKLGAQKWAGILVTAFGLVLVGLSSTLAGSGSGESGGLLLIGIVLVVVAQFFSALQMILEEAFMKGLGKDKRNWLPMHVVGMEGCFGIVIVYFFVFPITYAIPGSTPGSHYDNPADAIAQMLHSWQLSLNVFIYVLSIAFYNFFSLSVAKKLTTVHRTLIDASRTILVWGVDLMLYYLGHYYALGEAWIIPWSFLELAGFIVLFLGTLLYNRIIVLPFLPPAPEQTPYPLPDYQTLKYRFTHCTCLLDNNGDDYDEDELCGFHTPSC